MNYKILPINAGSVIAYKEYSTLKSLWYQFIHKPLAYNRFFVVTDKIEWLVASDFYKDVVIFEPKKPYNHKEKKVLKDISNRIKNDAVDELFMNINIVRPHTFTEDNPQLDDLFFSPFYKQKDVKDALEKGYTQGTES